MAQIDSWVKGGFHSDYYEDLTPERLEAMLGEFRRGDVPTPGPQNGRWASEPLGGATSLTDASGEEANASVALAGAIGDTVKRIDGTEVPLRTPWRAPGQADDDPETAARDPMLGPSGPDGKQGGRVRGDDPAPRRRGDASDGVAETRGSDAEAKGRPEEGEVADAPEGHPGEGLGNGPPVVTGTTDSDGEPSGTVTAAEATSTPADSTGSGGGSPAIRPQALDGPRDGTGDDLTRISGIGPKLAALCNRLGFWHFDQIAAWSDGEIAWVDANLEGFRGRVTRDEWVRQARVLSDGGEG